MSCHPERSEGSRINSPSNFFAHPRWKSLEFSKEPLNIRYDELDGDAIHGRQTPTA
jgi:hypothetical protein